MTLIQAAEISALRGVEANAQRLGPGQPWPLGATLDSTGINFALVAPGASGVSLCRFDATGTVQTGQWPLPACSDGVWHGHLPDHGAGLIYGWRVHGTWAPASGLRYNPAKVLLDPYARRVVGSYDGNELLRDHVRGAPGQADPRDNALVALKAQVLAELPPIPDDEHVRVPKTDMVLAEMHVRGATRNHPQIEPALRGTYAGLADPLMLAHLRRMGVTTLSLLPIMQACSEPRLLGLGLSNYWGYNTLAWFCPDPRFWSGRPGTTPEGECREMVRKVHEQGLEVVLDVVFNHSAEGDLDGPTFSLRGIDNRLYYRARDACGAEYENWSGCGNTLDLSQPRVLQLVLDAMRFWVERIGVDGFRFDLAPVLGRGAGGSFDRGAAFFAAVAQDPVLSRVKLIAEPWDLGSGGYQLGGFPAGWQEWNDRYRDTVRRYWLTGEATRAEFVTALAGSSEVFAPSARDACSSINFISAHDGFTLSDSVSYVQRHNQGNGEGNRDGHGNNHSTNAGVEGPTHDAGVLLKRKRLQRAMLATLALSVGTPMLLLGDEIGHSQQGNNNAYCQDNATTWLDWAGADIALVEHVAACFSLRRASPSLRRRRWLDSADVRWLAPDGRPLEGDAWWSGGQRGFCALFEATPGQAALALLFNPGTEALDIRLPADHGPAWSVALCSADPSPKVADDGAWRVPASSLLALSRSGA
jgi:glycogen operon protein